MRRGKWLAWIVLFPALAGAQSASPLARIPIPLPADAEARGQVEDGDGRRLWARVPLEASACAAFYLGHLQAETRWADGWYLTGYGAGPVADGGQRWVFGLLDPDQGMHQLRITSDVDTPDACRLELTVEPFVLQGDTWRWAWPPLPLVGGARLELDPLAGPPGDP